MKKKVIISSLVLLCLFAILFIPIPRGTLDDGGTRVYSAATYKIVVWNKLITVTDENGQMTGVETYAHTTVFWFPDHFKSIDELWEIEIEGKD